MSKPIGQAAASLTLDPPKFSLPDDEEGRYELWTMRLPVDLPTTLLDKLKLPLNKKNGNSKVPSLEVSHNGKTYKVQIGDPVENENFRLLVPATDRKKAEGVLDSESDSDSDDDDSDKEDNTAAKKRLEPSKRAFDKHWNFLEAMPEMSERELAPRFDQAPPVADPSQIRKAYAHVSQRTGLKRRWMPRGSKVTKDDIEQEYVVQSSSPATPKRAKTSQTPKSASKDKATPTKTSDKAKKLKTKAAETPKAATPKASASKENTPKTSTPKAAKPNTTVTPAPNEITPKATTEATAHKGTPVKMEVESTKTPKSEKSQKSHKKSKKRHKKVHA